MILLRLAAALLSVSFLASCQTAGAVAQEPFTILNDVFSSVGRAFHSSDNDRQPGDSSIEAKEAKEAQDQLASQNVMPAEGSEAGTVAVAAR
jgi:hypothetical protein